jgi:hypothetical protein
MDFKLVSKNNLGAVTALVLVIILSQSRFFNFLLDTALGRAILILFVLFISYTNKILGVVSVLFIIIMFNNSDIGYMEGFARPPPRPPPRRPPPHAVTTNNTNTNNTNNTNNTPPAHHSAHRQPHHIVAHRPAHHPPPRRRRERFENPSDTDAAEGFNLQEMERNIFGKKSNSVTPSKPESTENVEPFSNNAPYSEF